VARRFPKTPVVTARYTRDLLDGLGFSTVIEVGWHEVVEAQGLRITGVPAQHWSPRVFLDTWRTFNAYLIEADGRRILFGGDTAFTDAWQPLAPVDLAIVGIGAYDPYVAAHATPEQAWRMTRDVAARHVATMHHSTFRLSHEPTTEPLRRLLQAAGDQAGRVIVRAPGDVWIGGANASVAS
jgi:L-ascorbate metabolism protein UlaG (beta-lactamase superfamily)